MPILQEISEKAMTQSTPLVESAKAIRKLKRKELYKVENEEAKGTRAAMTKETAAVFAGAAIKAAIETAEALEVGRSAVLREYVVEDVGKIGYVVDGRFDLC